MSKQPKKKVGGSRNDGRKNGKANKQNPGQAHIYEPVSEIQKILNGGGLYAKWDNVVKGKVKGIPGTPLTKLNKMSSD